MKGFQKKFGWGEFYPVLFSIFLNFFNFAMPLTGTGGEVLAHQQMHVLLVICPPPLSRISRVDRPGACVTRGRGRSTLCLPVMRRTVTDG